jgi:hypothetical protein
LNVVAPPDTNTNGLPDFWETTYGITNVHADNDGDGLSNLAEYIANTNPTNAASCLKILDTQQTNGTFSLRWSSVGGTRYRIQHSDGGITNGFSDVIRLIDAEMDPSPYGFPSTRSFTDSNSPTNHARYYRIKVVP